MNKILEGVRFHVTTAIIIEQQDTEHHTSTVSVPSKSTRRRTFPSQSLANSNGKGRMSTKSYEVVALLRMTQSIASGQKVDLSQFIGNHECSSSPPSLLVDDGRMSYTGSYATLIKATLEQTNIHTLEKLSQSTDKTAVVIGVMLLKVVIFAQ